MIDEPDRAVCLLGYGTHCQTVESIAREDPKGGIYDSASTVLCGRVFYHSWLP